MLHPEARRLLELIAASPIPPVNLLTPAEARRAYRDRRGVLQPAPSAVDEVRPLTAPGPHGDIPLRLYRPRGSESGALLPVLVYFHGGGWVIGDLDTHDVLCRALANGAGATVVAVDYRMGPEHRFPAAVDDALAATRWLSANAAALGLDATRLAVGGDSAGGNLAAIVSLAAREAAGPPIRFQMLIYPATDLRCGHESYRTNGAGYLLTREAITWFMSHYLNGPDEADDWRASPLLHPDLSGLPRALVLTAGYDPLLDEGAAYAERLAAAGTRTSYVCFPGQIHGFVTMGRMLTEANTAVTLLAAELRDALAPSA